MDKDSIIKALREGAQSASAGLADSVLGNNVDFLAGGLRYAGLPVPENAVGGTKWLREQGLAVDNPGIANQLAYGAGFAPGQALQIPQTAGPMVQAIKGVIPR